MQQMAIKIIQALVGLLLVYTATAQLPAGYTGNWLATDGSNRFVLGIHSPVICYENKTWVIQSGTKQNDHWQVTMSSGNEPVTLDIYPKDSSTLVVTHNNTQQVLKRTRTFNYKYKPVEQPFKRPYFTSGVATVTGYIRFADSKKRPSLKNYIQVSYDNDFTAAPNYVFGDIDSLGRFTISIPLYKPQLCNISIERNNGIATILLQPGNNTLLAINQQVKTAPENTDYNKLMQRVAAMGDDGDFNNQYLHFLTYSSSMGYPEYKFPVETIKGKTVAEKKAAQFEYYKNTFKKSITIIDQLYLPGKASRQFIEFIKDEVKYNCAYALLNNLRDEYNEPTYRQYKVDSADLKAVYTAFLEQESPDALIHTVFYKLAGYYASELISRITNGRFSYSYSLEKMDERVEKEYGPLMSGNFMEVYRQLKKDYQLIGKMKDEEIIQKYFKGSQEEAVTYRYLQRKISDEFFKEARDSMHYAIYKREIKAPLLRFAANVMQLVNSSHSDDDVNIPSLYRIALFREYSNMINTPWRMVDSLNTGEAMNLALATLHVKFDSSIIKETNTEAEWQTALKSHRGKVVVIWMFPHYFRHEYAERSLYELKKVKEMYRGKNVVFLKCIQQRQRSDKVKQLISYLDVMKDAHELNNLFYVDRSLSMGSFLSDAINDYCIIYNESGQVHHPDFFRKEWNNRNREDLSIITELDRVLSGKGMYYEGLAGQFFKSNKTASRAYSGGPWLSAWTLYSSSGNYFAYVAGEPEKPVYGKEQDTIFNLLNFINDSIYIEHQLALHRQPLRRSSTSLFTEYRYEKEYLKESAKAYRYQFEPKEKMLMIFNNDGRREKQFRVVTISHDVLVLELVE